MDFGGPKENIDEDISAQGDKENRPGKGILGSSLTPWPETLPHEAGVVTMAPFLWGRIGRDLRPPT